MLLSVVFCLIISYVVYRLIDYWIIHPWKVQREFFKQGIPGRYVPIVGDILERRRAYLADKPFSYIEKMNAEFGDYYHTSFGPIPFLNINDPALIESILKTNSRFYCKAELARIIVASLLGYENLLLAEGENHTRHRRLTNPLFQQQNINSMISLMVAITSNFLNDWKKNSKDKSCPTIYDVSKEMSTLTLDIITGCVFGIESVRDELIHEAIYQNVNIALDEIEKRIYNLVIIIPILNELPMFGKRTIDKCRQNLKEIILKMIDQRRQGLTRANCKGSDLLDLLLAASEDNKKQKFTDEEVCDEALTFVLAGHETTATLMNWTLYHLVVNPDVYEQCQREVDSILNQHADLTVETISLLTYTEAVLKETLRYHQPAPTLYRRALVDNTIVASDGKEIHIQQGNDIVMNLSILNHSEKYWHEPEKFMPTRFFERQPPYLFPFGAGPRACIGQNFAMLEAKIMLAMLLHHFRFELVPGQNLCLRIAVTVRPKYGLSMRVWPR